MPQSPNFVGPSYNLDEREHSVQRTINMYPVPEEAGNERFGWVFEDAPGLTAFSGSGGCTHWFTDTFSGAAVDLPDHAPDVAPAGFVYVTPTEVGGMETDGSGIAQPWGKTGLASFGQSGGTWTPIPAGTTFSLEIVAVLTEL